VIAAEAAAAEVATAALLLLMAPMAMEAVSELSMWATETPEEAISSLLDCCCRRMDLLLSSSRIITL
jgi:hypothetical protein